MSLRFRAERADSHVVWDGIRLMAVLVELNGTLDVDRLRRALRQAKEAYPLLRCRYHEGFWQACWQESASHAVSDVAVRAWDGREDLALAWAEESFDFPVQVIVGQGPRDVLILKLDHAAGDFESLIQLVYRLADTYGRLERDPQFVLPAQEIGERGYQALANNLPRRERWRILKRGAASFAAAARAGNWVFPAAKETSDDDDCVQRFHRLEKSVVERLEVYGRGRRTTLFQLLLAAYFLALCEVLPESGEVLRIAVPVDLRRRIQSPSPAMFANLTGVEILCLKRRTPDALETVMQDIQRQLMARRNNGMGEDFSPLWRAMLPAPMRWLNQMIPYALKRRVYAKRLSRELASRRRRCAYTFSGGLINPRQLQFGSLSVARAWMTTHPRPARRELFLGVTHFGGVATLNLGWGPGAELEIILSRMLAALAPALA